MIHDEKALQLLVGCRPSVVRRLIERPDSGARLCEALLAKCIHSGALCGIVAAYDRSAELVLYDIRWRLCVC